MSSGADLFQSAKQSSESYRGAAKRISSVYYLWVAKVGQTPECVLRADPLPSVQRERVCVAGGFVTDRLQEHGYGDIVISFPDRVWI